MKRIAFYAFSTPSPPPGGCFPSDVKSDVRPTPISLVLRFLSPNANVKGAKLTYQIILSNIWKGTAFLDRGVINCGAFCMCVCPEPMSRSMQLNHIPVTAFS